MIGYNTEMNRKEPTMKARFTVPILAIISLVLFQVLGCHNTATGPYGQTSPPVGRNPAPNTVTIANMAFSPATLTVAKNATVTWVNDDNVTHTSTSDNNVWNTGSIGTGTSKAIVFSVSGTYAYHCAVHPMMTGTIIVQ